jgi:uncharacterized membrane protein
MLPERLRTQCLVWLAGAMVAAGLWAAVPSWGAADTKDAEPRAKDRPERAISLYTDYSRVTIPHGEPLRLDLTVENKGRRDEDVALTLTAVPRGWKAQIKGGSFAVRGVPVASEKSRTLTFTAEPEKGLRPGTYTFEIEGRSADGALRVTQTIHVTTEERSGAVGGELQVTTSYPVLRGPSDSSFEFSLEVNNKSDADRVVTVGAEAPKGWDVTIKPGFETKQITSLRVRAGSSERVALEVKPPRDAAAGEYPVVFRASTERAHADLPLRVVLTGIYKLDMTTPTGRLSMEAVAGRQSTTTLVVRNTGTAVNRNIKLSAFAPENWKVEFNPETIEALDPGTFRQVEARITPAAQALVGDYSVAVTADGEKGATKSMELRVTVQASSAWGWIGVGIIAAVIGGLGGLFAWLGRR